MKKEKISEIISLTDDRFIDEAATVRKKHTRIFRYAGIAACLTAAVTAAAMIGQSDFIKPSPEIITEAPSDEAGGGEKTAQEIATAPAIWQEDAANNELAGEIAMAIVPKWEDRTNPEKYTELISDETSYASQMIQISEEHIDTFLSDAAMSGYDIYSDKTYTVDARVYSIKDISKDCAVAVKIGDDEAYYVFVNVWYEPETLGDFITDLNLKNTVSFGKAYIDIYTHDTLSSSHTEIVYADFDDNVIWNMLTDAEEAKNEEYDCPYERIAIETNLSLLGYKNISFCVTPDGYVITNILSTQKCFFVGSEKFEIFREYLENNIPYKEHKLTYEATPDGVIPGKGDSGQTTPGYNPNEAVSAPPYLTGEEITSPPYNPETDPVPPGVTSATQSTPVLPELIIVEETTAIN